MGVRVRLNIIILIISIIVSIVINISIAIHRILIHNSNEHRNSRLS